METKLVIWDLDDTLWNGTLAEGDEVSLFEHRANIIRELNRCGIVSSICSKNDPQLAQQTLKEMGLWDEFVFPRIAFVPKGSAVRQIIEDMQLRAANVLFVDDSDHNLNEVKYLLPDIHITNASRPESDELLHRIIDENKHRAKSRLEEYRILQAKKEDRLKQVGSNEEFLRSSDIHATFPYLMDNLDFSARIEELVNRSNQLNYTETRLEPGSVANMIIDVVHYDTWSVFVWDKYGYYGLVGFVMADRPAATLIHCVFSCRVMHMGIEHMTLNKVREIHPQVDLSLLKKKLPPEIPDWIKEDPFHDRAIRQALVAKEAPGLRKDIALRIMCDCQSGGIAHFSRWRDTVDFDNLSRNFGMHMVLADRFTEQNYPHLLVYGAGIDYPDARWPDLKVNVDMYRDCVEKFCSFIKARDCKMLVILPPDNVPEEKYRPHIAHTRARTIDFNVVWKEYGKEYPNISILDLSAIAQAGDMSDVSHYYAGFLQKIAGYIDDWYEANI